MKTESVTHTIPLEEAILIPQLLDDVSNVASGWFLRPGGFEPETWSVQVLPEPKPSSTAANGLDASASGDVEAHWQELLEYRPRTALGQRLWNIRARILASGASLLSWDDIDRELADRRGEAEDDRE